MKYDYYRCQNCKAIVTLKQIKKKGHCGKCGKGRISPAYLLGFNMPYPWEFILIWLNLR